MLDESTRSFLVAPATLFYSSNSIDLEERQ
jgi:hypothetical protein